MSTAVFPSIPPTAPAASPRHQAVIDWITSLPDSRDRIRWTLREALDSVLDGQRTGRWHYHHLIRAEKAQLGPTIAIMLAKEFALQPSKTADWRIAGADLHFHFSAEFGTWNANHGSTGIDNRNNATEHDCCLAWMNDDDHAWAIGFTTLPVDPTSGASDADRIATENCSWLWGGCHVDLPVNQLLELDDSARNAILGAGAGSGQTRINELLRRLNGQIVERATILTVAQQTDAMKRPRDARLAKNLGKEGYLILGHQDASPAIARALGLPTPTKGQFLPIRITPAAPTDTQPTIHLDGRRWRIADPSDPLAASPHLPKREPTEGWDAYLST